MTHVQIRRVTSKLTRTYLTEGYTRTVVRVDVGRNLEHKAGKLRFFRLHLAFFCLYRTRTWRNFHKTIEQFLHTEVVQSRTKEHRSQFSFQVIIYVEFRIYSVNQFQLTAQLFSQRCTDMVVQILCMDVYFHLLRHHLLGRLKKVQFLLVDVIHPLETWTTLNRPRQRAHVDNQFFLQFIQQIERVFSLTVHLVDEDNHRRVTHTADFHQLTSLCFHTLRSVHHDDYTVHCRQGTIRIFGKILVTRCIEDINLIVMVVKFHHGGSDRDTTLLFDVHPVGRGGFLYLV